VPTNQLLIYLLIIAVVVPALSLTSCSEDDTGTNPRDNLDTTLDLEGIILNPKSPAGGDTLFATAVVSSDTTFPGDFTRFSWSSDGGSFLESNLSTVRWVAPNTSTKFTLSVTVSNEASSASGSEDVFVSGIEPLVASGAGEMTMTATGDAIYYFSSPFAPSDQRFFGQGVSIYDFASGLVSTPMQPNLSFTPALNKDLDNVAYLVPRFIPGFFVQIRYTGLVSQVETVIPNTPFFQIGPQYAEPDFSPDGSLLAYQVWHPDQFITPPTDTFVVAIWDLATETEKRVAVGGRRSTAVGLNFHPTFSSDGNHLVYMADTSGTGDWELYSLPVTGGTVPVDTLVAPTKLTFSGGVMGSGGIPANRPKIWSPDTSNPVLATLDDNGRLRLVPTTGAGDVEVLLANVLEFKWSTDGQTLAVSTGNQVWRVDRAGAATEMFTLPDGDVATRLSWSSDDRLFLFSARRLGDAWYEIWDTTNSIGLTRPLAVTPRASQGEAAVYQQLGSLSPVWSRTEPIAYMLFFDSGQTPRIDQMDFGGLSP